MDLGFRPVLIESILLALKPIIRLLLKARVPVQEFISLAEHVYVKVATEEYGIRGRPTNVSRTAILTGLNRRNVARIRATPCPTELDASFVTPAAAVLSAWHHDPDYLDEHGLPLILPMDGPKPSFESLVRVYASDLPHVAMVKEICASGAVWVDVNGRVRALTNCYIPNSYDPNRIRLWGSVMHDIGTTLTHNLAGSADQFARFERRAISRSVSRTDVAEFSQFLEREGQLFLERVDSWLTQHRAAPQSGESPAQTVRLGAGLYMIENLGTGDGAFGDVLGTIPVTRYDGIEGTGDTHCNGPMPPAANAAAMGQGRPTPVTIGAGRSAERRG